MKRFIASIFLSLFLLPAAQAEQLQISMVYSNSSSLSLPFELFSKGRWAPDPEASYVKLHLYLNRPARLSGFEVTSCDKPLNEVTVFANFDEWLWKLDQEASGEFQEPLESESKARSVKGKVDGNTEVRSLTFNFEKNKGFALCGLKLYDRAGKAFDIITSRIVQGTASASSTLEPKAAYHVMNLFDSRFESAWASDKQPINAELKFEFAQPQTITRLRIWSGYQRSPEHCIANSRPKSLRLEGDNGYVAKVAVQDTLGAQEIILPKPFSGKNLKLVIDDSYRGKSYADLVISELRFGDSAGWFMLDPLPHIRAGVMENRNQFRDAGLQTTLDTSLLSRGNATLRLRSDGSFYLAGMRSTQSSGDMNYFALGNYEIKAKDASKGLQLRLFGLFHETEAYGDCNGCGRDCNRPAAGREKIFQELVWLKPDVAGKFVLTPVSGTRIGKKALSFVRDDQPEKKK